jgi:DNA-directed RNA polymerase specialized sigma24 family protein
MGVMTDVGPIEARQTIASAAAGDQVAFARIVAAHHSEMVRICHSVSRDRGLAEEAVRRPS